MSCFGRFSNTFASEGSLIFLPKLGSVFSRTTGFVLKMISVFSRTTGFVLKMIIFLIHGLGKCEGVGEDSRHGNRHVDIQVGSRIYLSVCLNWIIS